jgi:hypothetical protein
VGTAAIQGHRRIHPLTKEGNGLDRQGAEVHTRTRCNRILRPCRPSRAV